MIAFTARFSGTTVKGIDEKDDGVVIATRPECRTGLGVESDDPIKLFTALCALHGKRVRVQVTSDQMGLFEPRAEVAVLIVEQNGIIIDVQAFAIEAMADAQAEREQVATPEGAERKISVWANLPIYDGKPKAAPEDDAPAEGDLPDGRDGEDAAEADGGADPDHVESDGEADGDSAADSALDSGAEPSEE
jgi:hypothetical protein